MDFPEDDPSWPYGLDDPFLEPFDLDLSPGTLNAILGVTSDGSSSDASVQNLLGAGRAENFGNRTSVPQGQAFDSTQQSDDVGVDPPQPTPLDPTLMILDLQLQVEQLNARLIGEMRRWVESLPPWMKEVNAGLEKLGVPPSATRSEF
ncbi:hypothetical protein I7I51_01986 [Histoplasma capsulatum]|uniref:Uncharacterized protein n=1 Tax=Ajellomyces capsulatus TaxID=5037 RepID=A0A8A1MG32_AJECA|nr:predicted protein [Histoplasma mississippiense (nom. inval.)]EDN05102.1 predicted protein [Histoplasma mississippiense (nom. inval.)]QSS64911.1 hypothetical protein I7I51_01986 [Histoplasma capsulatum]